MLRTLSRDVDFSALKADSKSVKMFGIEDKTGESQFDPVRRKSHMPR